MTLELSGGIVYLLENIPLTQLLIKVGGARTAPRPDFTALTPPPSPSHAADNIIRNKSINRSKQWSFIISEQRMISVVSAVVCCIVYQSIILCHIQLTRVGMRLSFNLKNVYTQKWSTFGNLFYSLNFMMRLDF